MEPGTTTPAPQLDKVDYTWPQSEFYMFSTMQAHFIWELTYPIAVDLRITNRRFLTSPHHDSSPNYLLYVDYYSAYIFLETN